VTDAPRYPIESVDRAIRLLSMFGTSPALSLADVAKELDVTRSTAHRLLAMFTWHRYAQQDQDTKLYLAGPTLLELSLGVVRRLHVADQIRPLMHRVAGETGETVHLVVLDGVEVSFVDGVESTRALRAGMRIGARLPAHATASGKALMSVFPEQRVAHLFREPHLDPVTADTVRTRDDLVAQLKTAHERGFAVSDQESEPGLVAISVRVPGSGGRMDLALSVAMPSVRADSTAIERIGSLLVSVVDAADLGD
jgi:IclR family transcriptional regulator, acetate operon repressor